MIYTNSSSDTIILYMNFSWRNIMVWKQRFNQYCDTSGCWCIWGITKIIWVLPWEREIFTVRKQSLRKVMFLHVCVCPQGGMHGGGVWQGWGMHSRGVCMVGGMCGGGHAYHSRYYGIQSMSGRYILLECILVSWWLQKWLFTEVSG